MGELYLLSATRILERTMPVMTRRLLVYGVITLGWILAILMGAGTFFGLASFGDNPGFWGQMGAFLGLGASAYAIYRARQWLFYHCKLPHLAAMVRKICNLELPPGKAQLPYLQELIQPLFPNLQETLAYYRKIHQVVTEAIIKHSNLSKKINALPKPIAQTLQQGLPYLLFGYYDQAILAFAFKEGRLSACREGASVFVANQKAVLTFSIILLTFLSAFFLIAFWLFLKVVLWVDTAVPADFGIWNVIFALILSGWIKAAFLDPIITTATTMKLFDLAEKQKLSQEVMEKLSQEYPSLSALEND
ncbi:MAG: hypothetical protein AXA67_09055 [Methylothermaceae bacteria B42]|nr:MAG: hypothetical protein AXA67_09055 [Methylothermaceae bacteria B42]HHJ39451.1 hypothetical protein [Methylothermaceae bacterium]